MTAYDWFVMCMSMASTVLLYQIARSVGGKVFWR